MSIQEKSIAVLMLAFVVGFLLAIFGAKPAVIFVIACIIAWLIERK